VKPFLQFVSRTVVRGFLVVLPIVLVLLVLIETVEMAEILTAPLVGLFDLERVWGFELSMVISILLVVLVCFLAGLVMATSIGCPVTV